MSICTCKRCKGLGIGTNVFDVLDGDVWIEVMPDDTLSGDFDSFSFERPPQGGARTPIDRRRQLRR